MNKITINNHPSGLFSKKEIPDSIVQKLNLDTTKIDYLFHTYSRSNAWCNPVATKIIF